LKDKGKAVKEVLTKGVYLAGQQASKNKVQFFQKKILVV